MILKEIQDLWSTSDKTKEDRAWINERNFFKSKNLNESCVKTKQNLLLDFNPSKEEKLAFLKKFKKNSHTTWMDTWWEVGMKIIDDLTKGPEGLDINLFKKLLQDGYEQMLYANLNSAKRIAEFAKQKWINVKTTLKLLQKVYESHLSGGSIHSGIEPFAKELEMKLKPTKKALQKGYNGELEDNYLESMIEIYEFAKKLEIKLHTSKKQLQKMYDEYMQWASSNYQKKEVNDIRLTKAEKTAEFAKKLDIKLNIADKKLVA